MFELCPFVDLAEEDGDDEVVDFGHGADVESCEGRGDGEADMLEGDVVDAAEEVEGM